MAGLSEIIYQNSAEMLFTRGNIGNIIDSLSTLYNEFLLPGGGSFPPATDVRSGVVYGPAGNELTGNLILPIENNVRNNINYGGNNGSELNGDLILPDPADVKIGVGYGADGTELNGTLQSGNEIFINLE